MNNLWIVSLLPERGNGGLFFNEIQERDDIGRWFGSDLDFPPQTGEASGANIWLHS